MTVVRGEEPRTIAPLEAGELVAGRYRIDERVGAGGMGIVYRVRDTALDVVRALKVMHPSSLDSEAARDRFKAEVRTTQALSHPNLVGTLEFGRDAEHGVDYYTMELLAGGSLRKRLSARFGSGRRFSVTEVRGILGPLLDGLAHAHGRNLVHRDIKPENILFDVEGTVKLADFGLAKVLGSLSQTSRSGGTGTPYYMAPEQVRPDGTPVDARADLYAVGVVLYELLVGRPPSVAYQAPSEVHPEASLALDGLVRSALAEDRADRPSSAAAMREALDIALPAPAPEDGRPGAPAARPRRRIFLALAAAIAALGAIVGATVLGLGGQGDRAASPSAAVAATPATTAPGLIGTWTIEWEGVQGRRYTGRLEVERQLSGGIYDGSLLLRFEGNGSTVEQDARVTELEGDEVHVVGSNPSRTDWSPDTFHLERSGDRMSGFTIDDLGRRGSAIELRRVNGGDLGP